MATATKRSHAERALYIKDTTVPKITNTVKVVHLEPPQHIKDNPTKLDWWNYLCTDLAGRQILSPSYIMPLIMLVDNIHDYHEYRVLLEGSGPLIPVMSKDGQSITRYVENPLAQMVKRIEAFIHRLCEKFGFNPRDAVYVTNPDILTKQTIEAPTTNDTKKITYFQAND